MEEKRLKVGIGVMVIKNGKILFMRRKGSHGEGTWNLPGGHLDFGESLEDCARRETLEEAGIKIRNIRIATVTNDIFRKEGKHYITVFMLAEWKSGKERIMEPEKCSKMGWFDWSNLPKPLFLSEINLLKQGYSPFKKQ